MAKSKFERAIDKAAKLVESVASGEAKTVNGQAVRVSKYHRADLAFASAARNNGSRKESARGPGGAQHVVLGDVDDKWGAYWVADCNRSASTLINAGFERA